MKALLVFSLITISSVSYSSEKFWHCYDKAEKAAEKKFGKNYDDNGFETLDCKLSKNKGAVVCEVEASKGGGEALDTYRVVLDKECDYVLRAELLFEE